MCDSLETMLISLSKQIQIEKSKDSFFTPSASSSTPISPEDLDKEMSDCLSHLDHILDRLDVLGNSSSPAAIPDLYLEISNSVESAWRILERNSACDANGRNDRTEFVDE